MSSLNLPFFLKQGKPCAGVDPGILLFANHGCNGTYVYSIAFFSRELC